jgi:Mor family transcriptional regulator
MDPELRQHFDRLSLRNIKRVYTDRNAEIFAVYRAQGNRYTGLAERYGVSYARIRQIVARQVKLGRM